MGTKVECKSYPPDYYPLRNLSEDSSSRWSRYYEDKSSSGHFYTDFMPKPTNGYLEYDKEMLRRIMLEHDAIFRKQVYELHRLYKTQKNLMDELKMKKLNKGSIQMDTSLYSSRMPSDTQKIWEMHHLTPINISCNRAGIAGSDDLKPHLDFLKENSGQSSQLLTKNGGSLKDGGLWDSELTGHPRRTFDLELPADIYIDSEVTKRTEARTLTKKPSRPTEPLGISDGFERENDVKLTLGTNKDSNCGKDGWKLDLHQQNGRTTQMLADLNEPVKGLSCEGETAVSNHFLGVRNCYEEIQDQKLPLQSEKYFLSRDFLTDKHRDEGTCSNFINVDKVEAEQEWPSFKNCKGENHVKNSFNSSLYIEKPLLSSEPMQLKLKTPNILSPDCNRTQTWLGEKPIDGIKISHRSSQLPDSNRSGSSTPQMPGSLLVVPHDYSASSPVSSWRKPAHRITHVPIAVQALPCFKGPAMINSQNRKSKAPVQDSAHSYEKLHANGDLLSHPRFQIESSYSNCFQNDIRCGYNSSALLGNNSSAYGNSEDNESEKCSISLNQALRDGTQEGITAHRDIQAKHEVSYGGMPLFGIKPAHGDSRMELGFSQGHSQLKFSSNTMASEVNKKMQDFPSSLQGKERRMPRNEAPFSLNSKKILGFPIVDNIQQSAICSTSRFDGNYNGKNAIPYAGQFRNHINLNLAEISPEDEAEFSSQLSVLSIPRNNAPTIDREAPTYCHGEIRGIDTFMTAGKAHGEQENEKPHEMLDRLAAENLVAMSSIYCPLAPTSCSSLRWFAEVVSSKAASAETSGDDDDGLDAFEAMTLKLEEVKPDEYWCRPQEPEKQKDDDDDDENRIASLLFTRPRRGQARKRRQRRDFQKDILPGLASLSRYEVTEDLQAFGGIMKASGRAWPAGSAKRTAGRKGANCQAKARQRRRSLSVAVAEVDAEPTPPLQPPATCSELEMSGTSIMGWGRTTRRCRRQRVTAGNASILT